MANQPGENQQGEKQPAKRAAEPDTRKARLAAQLRANLSKRKAQARSRRAGEADRRPDGLEPEGLETEGLEPKGLDPERRDQS